MNIVTDSSFSSIIAKPLVLIKFEANWCGPCRQLNSQLDVVNGLNIIEMYKMDIDENPNTPTNLGLRSIPVMQVYSNSKLIDSKLGLFTAEKIRDWIFELKRLNRLE